MSDIPLCKKCKTPVQGFNGKLGGTSALANATFTLTGFLCQKCGHYNNLKPRKKKS